MKPDYLLGVNHHLLFPRSMADDAYHEQTLREIVTWPEIVVLDGFCAGDGAQRDREATILRESGKTIVYNSPLLYLIPGCDPNGTEPAVVEKTRVEALKHLNAAHAAGARYINIASGQTPGDEDRERAWQGWTDFLTWFGIEAGKRDLIVVIEPFDSSIGKNLLIGPTADAVRSVEDVRARGADAVGLMIDMGHLPIMGETFRHALELSRPYLHHVHLGSAVMKDPDHPLYGDNHPPLGIPEGEHDVDDLAVFLTELVAIGYFECSDQTLTMEMRPYEGKAERESVAIWIEMLEQAWMAV
jgi:sugar phosphate isomerase/epimerase